MPMSLESTREQHGWHIKPSMMVLALVAALGVSMIITLAAGGRDAPGFLRGLAFGAGYAFCSGILIYPILPMVGRWLSLAPWPAQFAGLLGATALLALPAALGANALFVATGLIPARAFWGSFRWGLPIASIIGLLFTAGFSFYGRSQALLQRTQGELKARELDNEKAARTAVEAKLSSLESHLRPHFLFNALNSIASLIRSNPEQAERMIERLAELLRFALDAAHSRSVGLGDELATTRSYLEMESVRFGDRLRYSIRAADSLLKAPTLPLGVQTLVENSIKHAVSQRPKGGQIDVEIRREEGFLQILVTDDGPGFDAARVTAGHGLDNLMKRLQIVFGPEASLEIQSGAGRCTVSIRTPLGEDSQHS